jgi:putative methionine-R-sulfoxide reductase with GAF domain
MNELIRRLAQTVDSERPREERARAAAELVRNARSYRWVGIYDVGDDEIALIGRAGSTAVEEAMRTQTTVSTASAVVPILGPESGIAIGTLDAESGRIDAFTRDDVEFLEECASVLRPLYD